MGRVAIVFALMLTSAISVAAGFEYGIVSIVEGRTAIDAKQKREVIVRADLNSGNDFFCREQIDDLPDAKVELLWNKCISQLVKQTPGASLADVPGNAVYYEPIILSLFGRLGWEVYDVSESTLETPAVHSVTTLFRVKRAMSE